MLLVQLFFAKTCLMSAVLTGLLSVEVSASSVLSVKAEGTMNVAGGMVDDSDRKVDVAGGKVDVKGSEVDAAGSKAEVAGDEMDTMVKWILSACSMICFS